MELVADVGGTNTRCALVGPDCRPESIRTVANSAFGSLEPLLADYLRGQPVDAVRLAVAAPAERLPVRLTNRDWLVDPARIGHHLGVARVEVVNDCAAMALGAPRLGDPDLVPLRLGRPDDDAPRAVVAPGTGLGAAAVVRCAGAWQPLPGEGGHVTAAAADEEQARVLAVLRARVGHVSAERVLSGQGLVNLYRALAACGRVEIGDVSPEYVTSRREDPLAVRASAMFLSLLGVFAGNLALSLGARGGVYLAGGILPQLDRARLEAELVPAFLARGRFGGWLEAVPLWLVTHPYPALVGLAGRAGR